MAAASKVFRGRSANGDRLRPHRFSAVNRRAAYRYRLVVPTRRTMSGSSTGDVGPRAWLAPGNLKHDHLRCMIFARSNPWCHLALKCQNTSHEGQYVQLRGSVALRVESLSCKSHDAHSFLSARSYDTPDLHKTRARGISTKQWRIRKH